MLPTARIFALEANPHNAALMAANDKLRRKSIQVLPLAASDRDARAPFFVIAADYGPGRDRARRGMSSLHSPASRSVRADIVEVRTVRLDTLLATESLAERPIALWIDAEGTALEVLRGAEGILRSPRMLHVEVETEPFIGVNQKLFVDVEKLLSEAGFVLLATDQLPGVLQFNALFIRADLLRAHAAAIEHYAMRARVQRNVRVGVLRLLPARLRAHSFRLRLSETRLR
jgi:FkbM family methyltransferase